MEYRLEWVSSFVAVADHGGFSAAAEAVRRSQPRVSTHVADLERALGLRLFDRSRQPVVLTPEGRVLLPHARSALRQLASLGSVAAQAREGLSREVRLGVDPSAAPFLLPRLMVRLRDSHPGIRVVSHEAPAAELARELSEGRLDLSAHPFDGSEPPGGAPFDVPLEHCELWPGTPVAVLPEGAVTGTAAHLPLPPADLAGPLVVSDDAAEIARFAQGLDRGQDTAVFRTGQIQTLVSMVRKGWGTGLADALSLSAVDLSGLVVRRVSAATGATSLWWRAGRPESPARCAVRECLRLAAAPATHHIRTVLTPRRPATGVGAAD